jgi:hypothetical protein
LLPRHIDDEALRARLGIAMDQWKVANGITSPLAPMVLGEFAAGRDMARLYLNGGVFHSDLRLSAIWDRIGPDQQQFVEYQFRQYEGRVRLVVIELKRILDAAAEAGALRKDPMDLLTPNGNRN